MKTRLPVHVRRTRHRMGACTVELALIGPVLFLIVFGIFEIALGYMVQHLIQDTARQGCRVGVCYAQSNTTVNAKVNSLLQAEKITGATTKILVNNAAADVSSAKTGDLITVQISVPASKVSLFPTSGYLKGQLNGICTMRHE